VEGLLALAFLRNGSNASIPILASILQPVTAKAVIDRVPADHFSEEIST